MSSKLDYLSKYYSSSNKDEDRLDTSKKTKKEKKKKKKSKQRDKAGAQNPALTLNVNDDDDLQDSAWNKSKKVKSTPGARDLDEDDYAEFEDDEDRPTVVSSLDIPGSHDATERAPHKTRGSWETIPSKAQNKGSSSATQTNAPSTRSPSPAHRRRRYDSSDDDDDDDRQLSNKKFATIKEKSPSPTRRRRRRYDSSDSNDSNNSLSRRENEKDGRQLRQRQDENDHHRSKAENGSKRKRFDSSDEDDAQDAAGQRARRGYDTDSDNSGRHYQRSRGRSPDRKRRHDSDSSSNDNDNSRDKNSRSKKRRRYDSDSSDNSKDGRRDRNTRRRYDSDSDQSAGRSDGGKRDKERMSSGHLSGLQQAQEFSKAEAKIQEQKKKDAQSMVDKYGMGETTYRDKHGRKVDPSQKSKKRQQEEDPTLNQGKVQREAQLAQQEEYRYLSQLTFARHVDDERLEAMKQAEIRKGDPMAAYARRKQQRLHQAEAKSNGGNGPAQPARPTYKGPPPKPHRFGTNVIPPGYRWDGVYRGNGFEDKLLAMQFSAKRKDEEAYRWRSADM